ncbi:MAG: zinc-dependent metalloprotease [Glaciecola sp.]
MALETPTTNKPNELIDTVDQEGLISISYNHKTGDVYLRIKHLQLSKPLLFQSSLPHGIGSNDIGLDRGQLGTTRMVSFERFGNKLLLKQHNTKFRASSNNAAERKSIDEAFAHSVIAGFDIKHENTEYMFINYTPFLSSDIHNISQRLSRTNQGGYSIDRQRSGVYLPRTKAFPYNTELEALVTFSGTPSGQYIQDVTPDAKSVSVHLHHSFIAMPDNNYTPRAFHPHSGYWKHSFMDYSVAIDQEIEQKYIPRHRLHKKYPKQPRSEAVDPIVYYLDPGIPEPVMSALKEGALWWNEAFEAVGYDNAFQVKILPDGADPMDVRYNVIQWVHRATRGWSYGSSVVNPLTGEILKGHVTLGSLRVRQDFLIATSFTQPYTNDNPSTDQELELALNRIKQLSAHEVGHTLGIAHNFAASENNRASVMDYPHPYIQLKQRKIDLSEAYSTGMGEWDKYVVAYGYSDFAEPSKERQALDQLVSSIQQKGLLYKSDPDSRIPKRASASGHLWDNGSDAIAEFARVTEVRAHALKHFDADALPNKHYFSDLEQRLVPLYYSHRYQLDALVKQISGMHYTYSVKERMQQAKVRHVNGKVQHQALDKLLHSASASYLRLPDAIITMIPPKAYGSERTRESMPSRAGVAFDPITAAESISAYSLNILLQPERLNRLSYQHQQDKSVPSPQQVVENMFTQLIRVNDNDALQQRIKHVALSIYFDLLSNEELAPELKLSLQKVLVNYEAWLNKHKRILNNRVLLKHIVYYWQHQTWPMSVIIKPMPPGSPI